MGPLELLIVAFWVMLPAYVPNNAAVLAGGGAPIDGGRTWKDRRILGDGKTWRGTLVGTLVGIGIAYLLNVLRPTAVEALGVSVPTFPLVAMITLPLGAMLGDMIASFVKRRLGRNRGAPLPGVDQLDFAVSALVLTAIVAFEWLVAVFTLPLLIVVFVLTPILHVVTNVLAYLFGFKHEPW
ncbi:CDP-2,3-bis-(O-geranylgeranyl)-sn-glycerol synthase [Halalkalicoccus subterraneus]|uniref:CDP-2,3-bis-(O-geranylgeranyl)-sn-glycerol synthase n=1 Tax=Halalkalicoccus subterraneus TaxID=2675002 RepID=UPI000EFC0A51|nr:CDP-2,3-bis-(O-geranylgeranyl)-sn-glycerol synthase [Halalkalicoccus subterraneus]